MRRNRFTGINVEAVIRLIILLGFALFFYMTIQSGKAQYYVHPRIVPYMKFGIAAMVLISLFTARTVFRPWRRRNSLVPYLLFIVPLVSAFLLPARVIDATSLSAGTLKPVQLSESTGSGVQSYTDYSGVEQEDIDPAVPSDEIDPGGEEITEETSEEEPLEAVNPTDSEAAAAAEAAAYGEDSPDSALKLQGDTVVVGNDDFILWNDEIYINTDKYKGKKIEITGKVFKDKELGEDGFGVVRMMMSCCAADLQPVGLICRYDRAGELNGDAWIKVSGMIDTEIYEGEEAPIIRVKSVQSADKPEDEYVYP